MVVGDLPSGTRIAGIRLALNAGGSLTLTHRENVVGGTSGVTALWGLFGNFGLVFERGSHFLSVTSDLSVALNDPAVKSGFEKAGAETIALPFNQVKKFHTDEIVKYRDIITKAGIAQIE